jgi:hypothetical protein
MFQRNVRYSAITGGSSWSAVLVGTCTALAVVVQKDHLRQWFIGCSPVKPLTDKSV